MTTYFASDVHLRFDEPDRAARFAKFVRSLASDDRLCIVGDLCDFWFASRRGRRNPLDCPGLAALAAARAAGVKLLILAGNHDAWLGPLYEDVLGAQFLPGEFIETIDGVRVRAVHGHLLGARAPWKGVMESRWFLKLYGALPQWSARALESLLLSANEKGRERSDRRHLEVYSRHAQSLRDACDIYIFGHIHKTTDLMLPGGPRVIVLGSWLEGSSRLRIDHGRVEHIAETE